MAKSKKLSELERKSRETINGAKSEFGTSIKGYPIKWKIASDDGGRILEAFCEDWDACGILRATLPSKYMGFRTVVIGYALTEDKDALKNFTYEDTD